jgi:non-specific serine/threonine protein kinase
LAIELAAARVRHIRPQDIYEKLANRLHVLTGGARDLPARLRTMRNSIEWSYNLLDEDEKTLLSRLAVFRGGSSLGAVEAVCQEDLSVDVFDALASLVDKNLVQQKETPEGETRYFLLEMIREYARERLAAGSEEEVMRNRHASHFVELAERAESRLQQAHPKYWFHLLESEIDNLRVALEWSLGGDNSTLGIRIVSSTLLYWLIFGSQDEGIRWTQRLLTRIGETDPAHQVSLLRSAALLISYRDRAAAIRLSRQALAIARDNGNKRQLGLVLWTLGASAGMSTDDTEANALAEALALFRELDDQRGQVQVLNGIGEIARLSGDDGKARRAYEEAVAIVERMGDNRLHYTVLYNLSFIAQHEGNHQEAIRLLRRSLALCQEVGVPAEVARELLSLAGSLGAQGEPVRAARLFGAALAFLQRTGALVDPNDQPEHDRNIAFVRDQLGEAGFAAAWAEGEAMGLDQAIAYAQAPFASDTPSTSRPQPGKETHQPGGLTRREREVAQLIAQGKSNREIADMLVIAERTVEGHVSNILSKLGFRSRAQISAWVVENHLSKR